MNDVRTRPLTEAEFDAFRWRTICAYAAAHVRAGDWSPERAEVLATKETDALLPDGLATAAMVLIGAETAADGLIGIAWVALQQEQKVGAWIYDTEIFDECRGRGYGRILLQAVEETAREHGCETVRLNVFADNTTAQRLYESSGYELAAMHMRKRLR